MRDPDFIALFTAQIDTPASTPSSAPQSTSVTVENGVLLKAHIVIPDGHAGITGIGLQYSGTNVFPRNASGFISGNDEIIDEEINFYLGTPTLTVVTFNNDTQVHTHFLRLFVVQAKESVSPIPQVLSARTIEPSALDQSAIDLASLGVT